MLEKFSKRKKATQEGESDNIEFVNVPKHIAIIMDGNGRWAKQKGLPRIIGHREGMKVINKIVQKANEIGVEVLTLYAFSTENWKRPKSEIDYLMRLPEQFLGIELPKLQSGNVKVRIMGCVDDLPEHTQKAVMEALEATKDNNGLILNIALNYGSRFEMITAMKTIAKKVEKGEIAPEDIDEQLFENHLMTSELADPDLLIRTSGEIRLSNFMLWQLAYSEFWFTDVLWPDFNEHHFTEAIAAYQKRARRYGGV